MSLPQDWSLKLEESLRSLTTQWGTAKSAVVQESAVLAERMDRIEAKLDQVLEELRALKK